MPYRGLCACREVCPVRDCSAPVVPRQEEFSGAATVRKGRISCRHVSLFLAYFKLTNTSTHNTTSRKFLLGLLFVVTQNAISDCLRRRPFLYADLYAHLYLLKLEPDLGSPRPSIIYTKQWTFPSTHSSLDLTRILKKNFYDV